MLLAPSPTSLRARLILTLALPVLASLAMAAAALWGVRVVHRDMGAAVRGYQEMREAYEVGLHAAPAKPAPDEAHPDPARAPRRRPAPPPPPRPPAGLPPRRHRADRRRHLRRPPPRDRRPRARTPRRRLQRHGRRARSHPRRPRATGRDPHRRAPPLEAPR